MKTARMNLGAITALLLMPAITLADTSWQSPHFADHPLVGAVLAMEGKPGSSLHQIKQRAAKTKYVLLGEIHPNPDHHRLQAEILQYMVDQGRKPALVFEMATRAQQPVLDSFAAKPPKDASEIAGRLEWKKSGWPDFAMYRPMFEIALKNGLKMYAGNVENSTVRRLGGRVGSRLTDAERARFGLDKPLDEASQAGLIREIAVGHCNMMPESVLPLMADIQRARDFTMAQTMKRAELADGAVLIAGAGHTGLGRSVGALLGGRESPDVLAIALVEAYKGATEQDLEQKSHHFTMVTPRIDVTDHCDQFKKQRKAAD
jgi:uncharacterized iron-regulated protein